MPSCVVKGCRNHSGSIKKSQGITFHKFPSANDAWKNDWVQIIRENRNEKNWNPSKYSVVCSIHFEENDVYKTKGGLFRVIIYAVPKKFLFETSSIKEVKEEQPAEENSSSPSHTSSIVIESVASCAEPYIKLEPIQEDQFTEANVSRSSQTNWLVGEFSGQGLTLEQPSSLSPKSSFPHELSKIVTPVSAVKLEQTSVLFNPTERRLKYKLMKMQTLMLNQKKKIKTLNQKVRRLQQKNKSLKYILETLNKRELC